MKRVSINQGVIDPKFLHIKEVVGGAFKNEYQLQIKNELFDGSIFMFHQEKFKILILDLKVNQDITFDIYSAQAFDFSVFCFADEVSYFKDQSDLLKFSTAHGLVFLKQEEKVSFTYHKGDALKCVSFYMNNDKINPKILDYIHQLHQFVFHKGDAHLLLWKKSTYNYHSLHPILLPDWFMAKGHELYIIIQNILLNVDIIDQNELFSTDEVEKAFEVKNKILSDLRTKPKIHQLQEELGISTSKLEAVFKHLFDHTIYQFYQEKRIGVVKEDLKDQTKTISEIAYDYGFTNVHHLSKTFKDYYGMSPTVYRKNI
ncbi:AraC family transcriptional regulator [Flammeovirga sp. SJP92]|uniref:helix-turn-helix domain-containing protein n=1 Tax=Flammeovirga sp. SJP92 TaxID=1775430 RepID=UPI000787744F|nr:helix-turn-helix domain-containing protein [Flammeovirga sp. SJP92]KXX71498.1 hypothetical protein AVL50_06250 [Flammeovirga sp. SJP92]